MSLTISKLFSLATTWYACVFFIMNELLSPAMSSGPSAMSESFIIIGTSPPNTTVPSMSLNVVCK